MNVASVLHIVSESMCRQDLQKIRRYCGLRAIGRVVKCKFS